ncbi:aminotransferase class V-fold PLP-dependent enzyme [Asticcacaulis sp. AC460]|uniref:aminotransferase class V-fold PLP-dependent enzyme n=1 Tax=Asticcacaulis sp. AC460 TaxID=1282360 RepID=UPI0003F5CB78|nr:aminotransferase class V-fold PLP-dependent enzyme [Asticcacaulis sp. AC460]
MAYLDFAGAALYGASQVANYARRLERGLYGNPHSEHAPSRASMAEIDATREKALAFFDADPEVYEVVLTANTSAAIKLVAESYPFGPGKGLVLSADNHNSVNGMREYARAVGAAVHVLPLTAELRLDCPADRLVLSARRLGGGLLAFPAQSNFSGVQHDLGLVEAAQDLGFDVLLDAAGCGVSGGVSLREHPAEFLAFSFYKLFGLPTGLGALIVRKAALARLRRPWFAGGTVDFVSVAHDRHQLSAGHHGFEDGTPDFLNAGAVVDGFAFLERVDRRALTARLKALTGYFLDRVVGLKHGNGAPLVRVYGPQGVTERGGTVAFNLLDAEGFPVPYALVEQRAYAQRVAIRGGCFCNPGAAEAAFGFADIGALRCIDRLRGRFTVAEFQACLGADKAVGAVRLSVGLPTTMEDLDRALELVVGFAL